jgi:hypothetical protein
MDHLMKITENLADQLNVQIEAMSKLFDAMGEAEDMNMSKALNVEFVAVADAFKQLSDRLQELSIAAQVYEERMHCEPGEINAEIVDD